MTRCRLLELAKPKESKKIWCTSFGEKIVWGNQELITPITTAALNAKASERIISLAKPKRNYQQSADKSRPLFHYSCGRPSVICEVPLAAIKAISSERLKKLAEPKKRTVEYWKQRSLDTSEYGSPIWTVSSAAKSVKTTKHTVQLAQPKPLHKDYASDREVESHVTNAAKNAEASERVEQLSNPKSREDFLCFEIGPMEVPIRPVSKAATFFVATPSVIQLSKSKKLAPECVPECVLPISEAAKHAIATSRTKELSRPMTRTNVDNAQYYIQYNMDAFGVKEAAKSAVCSSRVKELAVPIQR
ncbi:sperm microtubule associated protein 2-like [Latimeria chalumnae]|uniref:Testicular haploid expressed gene protein-like n=1 Tax=Latimeria chalumnae TaxID=7897 RepID=M3XKJ3_LATCH|nr:PREDICTED: testicular haploid expressed gene protein-like isoform X2 [Latimeria chalumnae]|eukprot:XP_014353552.1 PREDICTED: testicular haploid expressed gene protein-like isoform X2 [Latimeria chalumnae]